jgi:hypothetical protein
MKYLEYFGSGLLPACTEGILQTFSSQLQIGNFFKILV